MKTFTQLADRLSPELMELAERLKHGDLPDGEIIKRGRNTLVRLDVGGTPVVIKSFDHFSALNRWVYTRLRKSKAWRSYANAVRLVNLGIGSPTPLMSIDVRRRGVLRYSYYVSEMWNVEPLKLRIEREYDGQVTDEVAGRLAAFTLELHEKGVFHHDYNSDNVLVDDQWHFSLVDLNRIRFGRATERERMLGIVRLCDTHEATLLVARAYARLRNHPDPDAYARYVASHPRD